MFARYLKLGSVNALKRELDRDCVLSKRWTTSKGIVKGGLPFSCGALFHLLRNPIYLGKIRHKGKVYEGEHPAIVEVHLFNKVQAKLDAQARRHRAAPERRVKRAPLIGKLFDAQGEAMTPSFSRGSKGKLYRYYVSASLQQGLAPPRNELVQRVAAKEIEGLIEEITSRLLDADQTPYTQLQAVHLQTDSLLLDLANTDAPSIDKRLIKGERIAYANHELTRIEVSICLPLRGGKRLIVASQSRKPNPDPVLIEALRKAHRMTGQERGAPAIAKAPISQYDRKILRLAFLAPDIQKDIIKGLQPPTLSLQKLQGMAIPIGWREQREKLGWRRDSNV